MTSDTIAKKDLCKNCGYPKRSRNNAEPCPHCGSKIFFRFMKSGGWYLYPGEIKLIWLGATILLGALVLSVLLIVVPVIYRLMQLQFGNGINWIAGLM